MREPQFSVVIPVYNRPQEVKEILISLTAQSFKNFEVIIVEDGSSIRCEDVVDIFRDQLRISYFFKPNSGPGPSRNFGFAQASGNYFVVFDSDCILPSDYLQAVDKALHENGWDAWGGPDRAHDWFLTCTSGLEINEQPTDRQQLLAWLKTSSIVYGKPMVGTLLWLLPALTVLTVSDAFDDLRSERPSAVRTLKLSASTT